MPSDYFLYVEDSEGSPVTGDAIDEECTGWIHVDSYSFEDQGGVNMLSLSLESDRSSPNLLAKLLLCDCATKVVLREYRKAGLKANDTDGSSSGSQKQLEIQLGDAYLNNWSISMGGETGFESLNFVPKRYTVEEFESNPQDGVTTGVTASGWDYQTNEEIASITNDATAATSPADVPGEDGTEVVST